jgi:hypothetical protein
VIAILRPAQYPAHRRDVTRCRGADFDLQARGRADFLTNCDWRHARSGQVWMIPFYFEDVWEGGHIICGHGSTFEIASELLIISGRLSPGGKVGLHYFRW